MHSNPKIAWCSPEPLPAVIVLNITMKELEDRLDPEVFCRVHKQAIVQLSYAKELHSMAGGHYLLRLSDGSDVQIGRNYAREFRARFA